MQKDSKLLYLIELLMVLQSPPDTAAMESCKHFTHHLLQKQDTQEPGRQVAKSPAHFLLNTLNAERPKYSALAFPLFQMFHSSNN